MFGPFSIHAFLPGFLVIAERAASVSPVLMQQIISVFLMDLDRCSYFMDRSPTCWADGDLRAGFRFRRALLFVASPASLRRIQGWVRHNIGDLGRKLWNKRRVA